MDIEFTPSRRGTIGVELELSLVDPETRELTGRAPELMAVLGDRGHLKSGGSVTGEYLATMIELVSGVHNSIGSAIEEMGELLFRTQEAASEIGVNLLACGAHPFSKASEQPIVETEHYGVVRDRNSWWGRQMIVCGLHVHIAVGTPALALPVVQGLTRYYPHLLALSASSPYWAGEDTGFSSQRTMIFQQLATNDLPWPFTTWGQFELYANELEAAGMITQPSEIRWDVRPAPRFGTVENRICDSVPTLAELGCLAAWTQVIGEHSARRADSGRADPYLNRWLVAENKWRAARYGFDTEIITAGPAQRHVPLRQSMESCLGILAPLSEELGCADEFAYAATIMEHGSSAERQRRVAAESDGDLRAVVDHLVNELKVGTT